MSMLAELYDVRFSEEDRLKKEKVWKVLCKDYFQQYIGKEDTVLELACGFGEFLNNISAKRKIGVDLNPAVKNILPEGIEFHEGSADNLNMLEDNSINLIFVSNFFEHLPNKEVMTKILIEAKRVLKPGGKLMMMQPNIKYCYDAYWDFYDHHLPLSHLSAAEGLEMTGYKVVKNVGKFVPYSTKSRIPSHPLLVKLYLKVPFVWRFMGKQFFLLGEKPQ